jgi:hypothetical protein
MRKKWFQKSNVQTAIITGIFTIISAIIAGYFGLFQGIMSNKNQDNSVLHKQTPNGRTDNQAETSMSIHENIDSYVYLEDNQIQSKIRKSLETDSIYAAIKLISYLKAEDKREEEFEHIFNYCLKNDRIEIAELLIDSLNNPTKKKAAKLELAHAKVKRM